MSNRALLQRYLPMVTFISEICGTNYEVILHDLSNREHSIVAIFNGHLSGRKTGDPLTGLARKLVQDKIYEKQDFITNYQGHTRDGKQFVSSTYFIKEGEELLGLLCINHDTSDLLAISQRLHHLMSASSLPHMEKRGNYTEALDDSIPVLSTTLIQNTVNSFGVSAARMTAQEKEQVILQLEQQGVFSTRGSVSRAAKSLNVSEPTVYRYLRRIRMQNEPPS